jgi:hypothetical protein
LLIPLKKLMSQNAGMHRIAEFSEYSFLGAPLTLSASQNAVDGVAVSEPVNPCRSP